MSRSFQRTQYVLSFVATLSLAVACTVDSDPDPAGAAGTGGATAGSGGGGGSGGTTGGTGGSTGGSGGTAGTGGSTGGMVGTTGGTGGAAAGSGGTTGGAGGSAGQGTSGDAGAPAFPNVGVCGQRGEGTVNAAGFVGFEEYYLIDDEGFGVETCVVRFDVTRVDDPPPGCPMCEWSHLVELSNPTVVEDVNGVCANSELGFDDERIAELDGSRIAYGYVYEYAGHVSVIMKYFEDLEMWDAFGNATWDDMNGDYDFDRRDGFCGY